MPVRRCPTCNRPFPPHGPCPRCALAAKPAQTAVAIEEPESPAANPVVMSMTVKEIPRPESGLNFHDIEEVYREEIEKALASAQNKLHGPEGQKDFEDLEQIVAFEIWQATMHYGDKMNKKLAFRIAKNQANKFLKAKAKKPTFLSIDDKPEDIEDTKRVEPKNSYAETLLNERRREGVRPGTWDPYSLDKLPMDWMEALEEALEERGGIPMLKEYVRRTYTDKKRQVAEAILQNPDMTVRDMPGIPKTTVHRLRREILEDFERLIRELL